MSGSRSTGALFAPSACMVGGAVLQGAVALIPTDSPFGTSLVSQTTSLGLILVSLLLAWIAGAKVPWLAIGGAGVLSLNYAARLAVVAATDADPVANSSGIISLWDNVSTALDFLASMAAT